MGLTPSITIQLFQRTFRCAAAFFFIICSRLSAVINVEEADDEPDVDEELAELEAPRPVRPDPRSIGLNLRAVKTI